jgi:hypothetical protein
VRYLSNVLFFNNELGVHLLDNGDDRGNDIGHPDPPIVN